MTQDFQRDALIDAMNVLEALAQDDRNSKGDALTFHCVASEIEHILAEYFNTF